jgi:hypothetical protein
MADARTVGWREVVIVAALAVGVVLGIDVLTTVVPGLRDVVTRTPILILVLVMGTGALLWRIASRRPPEA